MLRLVGGGVNKAGGRRAAAKGVGATDTPKPDDS
jgi:hypothetical protein